MTQRGNRAKKVLVKLFQKLARSSRVGLSLAHERNSPNGVFFCELFFCAYGIKRKVGDDFLCRYAAIILQTFTIPPPRQARHLPLHKGGSAKICSFDCSRKLHQISSCGLDSRQLVAWTHLSLQVCGYLFARWMP